jgi:hypothetical protein
MDLSSMVPTFFPNRPRKGVSYIRKLKSEDIPLSVLLVKRRLHG